MTMNLSISQCSQIIRFLMFSTSPLGLSLAGQPPATQTVTVSPGDDVQSDVKAAPEGTTFILRAGVYRMQSVEPKNRDVFRGEGSVILNGSQLLSFQPDPSGSKLWVANATVSNFVHGGCQSAYPLCGYAQDLFIDNVLQTPVSTSQGLKAGTWYFDRSKNKLYVPGNPAGHLAELGTQRYAFYGSAKGVQINNLTIEKYAAPAQTGAIGGNSSGEEWLVNMVEARWNHGRGISLGSGSQILNSSIHHNGQLGISLYGTNSKAIHNEISYNNYAGFGIGWEAGGSKFTGTTDLTVKSNYVHDNKGPGLWTDGNNVGTLYDGNTVVNNLAEGIVHEISYSAVIRNNIVKGNGNVSTVWLWNAQIDVQNSSNVDVYGNTVEVPAGGGNGIAIINQNRGSGPMGPWIATNNNVHDNTIKYLGIHGASGIVDSTGSAAGNLFDSNHYIVQSGTGSGKHWVLNTYRDWQGFLAAGREVHGNCCN